MNKVVKNALFSAIFIIVDILFIVTPIKRWKTLYTDIHLTTEEQEWKQYFTDTRVHSKIRRASNELNQKIGQLS